MIDEQGLQMVMAIKEAPRPENVSELWAFLGIINYYGKLLPNLSTQLAPLHEPSTNGLAERAKTRTEADARSLCGREAIQFLHKYRITPHSTTGIAPSELLMGRRLRSRLDLLHPDLPDKVEGKQWKQKLAHDTSHADRKF